MDSKAKVARMHAHVADALGELENLFSPEMLLTFIARMPGDGEADVLISADDPKEILALVQRRIDAESSEQAALSAAGAGEANGANAALAVELRYAADNIGYNPNQKAVVALFRKAATALEQASATDGRDAALEEAANVNWPTDAVKCWTQEETELLVGAFNRGQEHHGFYETLYAVGAAILKNKAAQIRALKSATPSISEDKREPGEDLIDLLPGSCYMGPPDGSSRTIREQFARMAKDAERYRHLRDCNSGSLVIVEILGFGTDDQVVLTEDDADKEIDAAISRASGWMK